MPSSGCPQLGLRFLGSEYLVLYMYRMGELWEISSSFMRMSASNRPTPLNIPQLEFPVWLPVFAPRLPVSDQSLRDIIDALHWWRTGPSQPTAASIVLNVRIVELVASRVGETTWTTYLESYFKNAWIHSAIMQILYMALREALTRHLAPEVQPRQARHTLRMRPISANERCIFFSHLSSLLKAHIPLHSALTIIASTKNNSLKEIVSDCADLIAEGTSLSDALKIHGLSDYLAHALLSVGEKTGDSAGTLSMLVDHLTIMNTFKQ